MATVPRPLPVANERLLVAFERLPMKGFHSKAPDEPNALVQINFEIWRSFA